MDRVVLFQTAVCTLAVSAISAGVSTFVLAANGHGLDSLRALGAAASLLTGSWLVYLGHCRSLLPSK